MRREADAMRGCLWLGGLGGVIAAPMGAIYPGMDLDIITLLFTEHDMAVVFSIAEKITVLHQGEVLAEGTPTAVRSNPEVQRVYLGETA